MSNCLFFFRSCPHALLFVLIFFFEYCILTNTTLFCYVLLCFLNQLSYKEKLAVLLTVIGTLNFYSRTVKIK